MTALDPLQHQRVRTQRTQRVDAVLGAVEGRDADRHGALARRFQRRVPAAAAQLGVGVGGDVEPDPAAVLERAEIDLELQTRRRGPICSPDTPEFLALHVDPGAVGLGAVHVDAAVAGEFQLQHHRVQHRPAPPVAGRKAVEVGAERHLGLGADGQRGARGGVRATRVGRASIRYSVRTSSGSPGRGSRMRCRSDTAFDGVEVGSDAGARVDARLAAAFLAGAFFAGAVFGAATSGSCAAASLVMASVTSVT